MSPRGPKPKPAAVKSQRSAVRSKREKPTATLAAQAAEPIPDATTPAGIDAAGYVAGGIVRRDWLEGEGLAVWARLAPRLSQLRLLQAPDVETFARYCRNFARWLKLQKQMDGEGETYETTSKHMEGTLRRVSPVFAVSDRIERMLLAFEDRFGLNPAERQRLFQSRANAPAPKAGELPLGDQPQKAADPAKAAPAAEPAKTGSSPVGFLH